MRSVWPPLLVLLLGCSGDDKDSSFDLYRVCETADECVRPSEGGDAACLDKGGEGFCTWSCTTDADCAGADADWNYVCASFESSDGLYCFPACQGSESSEDDECPGALSCRSTGGGSDNQQVCFPS